MNQMLIKHNSFKLICYLSFCGCFQLLVILHWILSKCYNCYCHIVMFRISCYLSRIPVAEALIFPFTNIQSKLFITSLVITEYLISDIKLLGTDLFLLKFPLYNRIFT